MSFTTFQTRIKRKNNENVTLYNRKQFALPETALKQRKQSVPVNKIKIKFSLKSVQDQNNNRSTVV